VVIWRSSHIEKHLGFLARFSGAELADRAVVQTKRFGANVPVEAVRLDLGDGVQAVHVGGARSPVCWRPVVPARLRGGRCPNGTVKRVASAVGEGAMAVRLLHDHLARSGRIAGQP
jgi:hypothetical protein